MSSINRLDEYLQTVVGLTTLNRYPVTISAKTRIAKHVILTPTQASNINSIQLSLQFSKPDSLSEDDRRE